MNQINPSNHINQINQSNQINKKNKVAFCFWGLTRNLKITINSIYENLINVFSNLDWEIKIFMHTFIVNEIYTNLWSGEKNLILDNTEYILLNANHVKLDDQEKVKNSIDFDEYRSHGNPWEGVKKSSFQMLDNFILGSYSKFQVTMILKDSIDKNIFVPDIVIYCRPDVIILNKFPIDCCKKMMMKKNRICVPSFECYGNGELKVNDRFAVCNKYNYMVFGSTFKKMKKYSQKMLMHSETYLAHIYTKNRIKVKYIKFYFDRVRANGKVKKDHKNKYIQK